MKCTEIFYNFREANDFFKSIKKELAPELVQTVDEDTSEEVYIVFFNPPKKI